MDRQLGVFDVSAFTGSYGLEDCATQISPEINLF